MKSIKQQYIDLREGNMSQANFMRSIRMSLPQYVTNVTSFDDSIRILKNKGILTEADMNMDSSELAMGIKVEMEHTDDVEVAKKIAMDHLAENPKYYSDLKTSGVDTPQGLKSEPGSPIKNISSDDVMSSDVNLNKANPRDGFSLGFFEEGMGDDKLSKYETYTYTLDGETVQPEIAFYNNILKAEIDGKLYNVGQPVDGKVELSSIKGKTGTYTESNKDPHDDSDIPAIYRMYNSDEWVDAQRDAGGYDDDEEDMYDDLKADDQRINKLDEAKENSSEGKWKTVTGKDLYAQFREIDNLNGQEVLIGIDYEMEKNPKSTKLDAAKIVVKNLKKNPIYYTATLMSGKEGYEPEYIGGKSADPKAHQMQPLAKDNLVDKARGMKPVKDVEKVKKDSDKGGETNKMVKGVDLMTLIAKSVRGLQKMDATGEKMKKVSVKEGMEPIGEIKAGDTVKIDPEVFPMINQPNKQVYSLPHISLELSPDETYTVKSISGTDAELVDSNGEKAGYVNLKHLESSLNEADLTTSPKGLNDLTMSDQAKRGLELHKKAEEERKATNTQLKAAKGDSDATMDVALSQLPKLRERLKELIRKEMKETLGIYGGDNVTDVTGENN